MAAFNSYTQFKGTNPFGSQAKMLYHLDRLHEWVEYGDTKPIFVEFNLTDKCNLRCSWCISENCRSAAQIDKKTAVDFLCDFKKIGGKAVTFSGGGEPTLHPDFDIIAEYALMVGLDVGLMTNGVYPEQLNELISKFKWARFSVDTFDHAFYKCWKGRDAVNQITQNIVDLRKSSCKVGINVNVGTAHTVTDVRDTISRSLIIADYIQFRPILPRYFRGEMSQLNSDVWFYLKEHYSESDRINLSLDKLEDLRKKEFFPFDSCEGHFFNPVVHANGDVAVCMYHPGDSDFVFGNLYENTFKEIWKSYRRKEVIEKLRKVKYCEKCQVCCKLTELNKLLQFIKSPSYDADINFL